MTRRKASSRWIWLLALSVWFGGALNVLHNTAHGLGGWPTPTIAAISGDAPLASAKPAAAAKTLATSLVEWLIPRHGDVAACSAFDHASHGDALHYTPSWPIQHAAALFFADVLAETLVVRRCIAFQARGPPFFH